MFGIAKLIFSSVFSCGGIQEGSMITGTNYMEIVTRDILKRELDRTEKKFEMTFAEFHKKFLSLERKIDPMVEKKVDEMIGRYTGIIFESFDAKLAAMGELVMQNTRNIDKLAARIDKLTDHIEEDIEPRLNRVVFQLRAA